MKRRRAGQHEGAPPLATRPPIEVSARVTAPPDRLGAIRGLPAVVDARMQTDAGWRDVWADDLARRGGQ